MENIDNIEITFAPKRTKRVIRMPTLRRTSHLLIYEDAKLATGRYRSTITSRQITKTTPNL